MVSEPLAIGRRGTAVISDRPECPYAGGNAKCEKRAFPNAVAFRPLTFQLACATDSGRLFPRALFRRLFIVAAPLHFALPPLALTLLLDLPQGLVQLLVLNDNFPYPSN